MSSQNHLKSQISLKTQPKNGLTIKTWEKTPSQRGQTSKIDNAYTLSAGFKEAQGSQKGVKMEARMESLGTQNHKNPETRTLEKKATSRDRKKWVHGHLGGGSANALFSIKSHHHPRNRPYSAPGLQNDRPGFKNDCPGLKNDRQIVHFAGKKQDS